ncbi:uncharacterized protein ACDL77_014311 [Rhynchocyon petersi]
MVPSPTAEMMWLMLWPLFQGSLAQDYTLQVQRSVTVQEGLCVSIPCTFSYPQAQWTDSDSELVYWFKKGPRNFETKNEAPVATNNSEKDVKRGSEGRFQLLGDPGVNSCSLGITDARKDDGGTYFFRMERGKHFKYSYKDPVLTVNVTALTQVPDIIITEPLESGRPSRVTCSVPGACDRGTPFTFSWTGTALWSQESPLGVYNSSAITLTPGPQDHGTNLTCRVTFPRIGVTTERKVTLNVSYAPQNLTVHFFRGDCAVMEGESLCLVCVAVSNPPATISWARGNRSLSRFQFSDSGVLKLPWIQEEDEAEVTCQAQNPLGSQHVTLHLSVPLTPGPMSDVVLVTITAAVVKILLLGLCLTFSMKAPMIALLTTATTELLIFLPSPPILLDTISLPTQPSTLCFLGQQGPFLLSVDTAVYSSWMENEEQTDRPRRQRVRGPVPPAAEMLVLLLLLVWGGVECAGRGLQAGAEANAEAGSPPDTVGQQSQNHQLPGQVTVQQGLCVSIPCNFSHPQDGGGDPGSVLGYWFQGGTDSGDPVATNDPARRVKEGTQGRFQLLGDPRNGSCSLLIRDANKSDGATYFFQAKRGDKTLTFVDHKLSLTVTDLTQKPDIYVPETLEPGHLATLLCVFPGHSEGCPPPRISWSGAALSPQGAGPRNSSFSVLTLTPKPQDHNSTLTCHVNVSHGVSASSTVRLSVAHAPKDLVINVSVTDTPALEPQRNGSSLEVKKGQFLQLLCEADGHPPPTLSWVLNNRVLSWSPPSGPRTLVLERPQVGAEDTGRYTCRAENRLGSQHSWLDLSVQYPPENLRVMVSPANRSVTPGSMSDVVLVAITAAVVKTLLLGLCLTFSMTPPPGSPMIALRSVSNVELPFFLPIPLLLQGLMSLMIQGTQIQSDPFLLSVDTAASSAQLDNKVQTPQSGHPGLMDLPLRFKDNLQGDFFPCMNEVCVQPGQIPCRGRPAACHGSILPPGGARAPGSPAHDWSQYLLNVQSPVTVQQGLCVFIPCNFSYPQKGWNKDDPAYGYWFQEGVNTDTGHPVATNNPQRTVKEMEVQFKLVGDPGNGSCSLLIKEARQKDTERYFFRLERGPRMRFNYIHHKLTLNVTDLTQKPEVYIPEILEPGRPIYWSGAALFPPGAAAPVLSTFSVHTFTPRPQDHNTNLTCRVSIRKAVNVSHTVQLSVASCGHLGNGSNLEVKKGQFLRLLCQADGHPPPTLSWVLDNRVLSWSPSSGPRTLILERAKVGAEDTGRYTCRAENRLGSLQSWLDLSVQYPPENLRVLVSPANRTVTEILGNGTMLPVLEGQSLRLVCVADSSPPANLSWDGGSCPLNSSQPSDSEILELPRVQKEDEREVTCRAQSPLGSQHVTLRLSVLYPPELLGPSCSWEAEGLHCSCSARALPAPSLRWRVGDPLVEGNSSEWSLMVTSTSEGPWANSSLSLREGLSPDLGVHCEARNAHRVHRVTVLLLPGEGHQPGSPLESSSPAVATTTSGEDQELHYASFIFQGLKPREPQEQETTSTTEYSEIKIRR